MESNKPKTTVQSAEGSHQIGNDTYWIYNVTIPIAVKNPRFESDCDEETGAVFAVLEHDGYFAAETLGYQPFEFKGEEVDIFNDEVREAVQDGLAEVG